jgi:hypothetical protein
VELAIPVSQVALLSGLSLMPRAVARQESLAAELVSLALVSQHPEQQDELREPPMAARSALLHRQATSQRKLVLVRRALQLAVLVARQPEPLARQARLRKVFSPPLSPLLLLPHVRILRVLPRRHRPSGGRVLSAPRPRGLSWNASSFRLRQIRAGGQ